MRSSMDRTEIITAIEKLRGDSIDVEERTKLLGIIHFQFAVGHMAPIPVRATLRRGLICASLFIRRFGFVSYEESRRFRQAERGIGVTIVFVVLLSVITLSFGLAMEWILRFLEFLILGTFGVMLFPFLGALVIYVVFSRLLQRSGPPKLESYQRFGPWCIGCGYDLSGLESALGDELWVGPAVCPECGCDYPAVGE